MDYITDYIVAGIMLLITFEVTYHRPATQGFDVMQHTAGNTNIGVNFVLSLTTTEGFHSKNVIASFWKNDYFLIFITQYFKKAFIALQQATL